MYSHSALVGRNDDELQVDAVFSLKILAPWRVILVAHCEGGQALLGSFGVLEIEPSYLHFWGYSWDRPRAWFPVLGS